MACGAGLPVLAVATTIGHFIIMFVFPMLIRVLPRTRKLPTPISISYEDGRGLLRSILIACTEARFAIGHVRIEREDRLTPDQVQDMADAEGVAIGGTQSEGHRPIVTLGVTVKGKRPVSHLIARLSAIDGVVEVGLTNEDPEFE
jgi:putative Mg2+ transporter-C (MgtC) family protein